MPSKSGQFRENAGQKHIYHRPNSRALNNPARRSVRSSLLYCCDGGLGCLIVLGFEFCERDGETIRCIGLQGENACYTLDRTYWVPGHVLML